VRRVAAYLFLECTLFFLASPLFHCTLPTMIHPIFPSQKSLRDAVLCAFGVAAIVLCFVLKDYWVNRPLPVGFSDRLEHTKDSVLRSIGMVRDSVEMQIDQSVDEDLLNAMKEQYGSRARRYLDTAKIQQNLFRLKITSAEQGNFNFSVGSGNRSRPGTKAKSSTDNNALRTLWLDETMRVVGEVRTLSEAMPRVAQAYNGVFPYDTTAIRQKVWGLIPQSYAPQNVVWVRDTAFPEAIGFIAVVEQDSILRKEWMLRATKTSDAPERWTAEWQRRIVLVHPNVAAPEQTITTKTIVTILFWFLVVVGLLILFIVFLNKVRIKAAPMWLLWISVLTGLGFTLSFFSMVSAPWYAYLLMWVVYSLLFGLILVAIPLTSLIAVMREMFSEKFYTLIRFADAPLRSYHWGRMILVGASFGGIYSVIGLVLPIIGEQLHIAEVANAHIYVQNYLSPFMMRNPFVAFLQLTTIGVTIYMILSFVAATVAYRFVPRKFATLAMLILSSFVWILFASVQSASLYYVLTQGFFYALAGAIIFRYYDVLALLVFALVSTFLLALGLFGATSWGMAVPIVLLAGIILSALAAYRNAPEVVSESDYKPDFLTLQEEHERLHQEIAAAKSVQQKLLPRSLPTFDSVVVSAACIPAYEVGGDYYDFFPLDDKRLGVLIGDVSGKGISAAFYITLAKGVIVSQVRGVGSPSDVLHRVNALLYGVMERGKFVSMIYGIYNTETREFAFSNAGHNPLVVRRMSGEMSTISAKGMAIGLDKGERFERAVTTASVTLEKGDCILLYTDGVTEAMNTAHAEYGEERMMQAVQAAPLNAADIVSAALADVRKFAGKAHQHDDITLVALQAV